MDIYYASMIFLDTHFYHLQVCAIHWNCHHSHERLPQVQSKLVDPIAPVPVDKNCKNFYASKCSVWWSNLLNLLCFRSAVCGSLHAGSLCVGPSGVSQTSGLQKDKLRPGSLSHAFQNRTKLTQLALLYHLFEHFVEMWIGCLHLKNPSFKIFLWGN